ncbi:hypothetical protein MTO96_044095 [Rhipicephalus appendiculatus]
MEKSLPILKKILCKCGDEMPETIWWKARMSLAAPNSHSLDYSAYFLNELDRRLVRSLTQGFEAGAQTRRVRLRVKELAEQRKGCVVHVRRLLLKWPVDSRLLLILGGTQVGVESLDA